MPIVSLSVSSPGPIGTIAPQVASGDNANVFLALLNLSPDPSAPAADSGGQGAQNFAPQNTDGNDGFSAKKNEKDVSSQDAGDTVAPPDAPVTSAPVAASDNSQSPPKPVQAQDTAPHADNSSQQNNAAPAPANHSNNQQQDNNATPVVASNAAPVQSNAAATGTAATTGNQDQPKDPLHKMLQDQLGKIDQILLSIIQALSGTGMQNPTVTVVAQNTAASATAGVTDAASTPGALPPSLLLQQLSAAGIQGAAGTAAPGSEIALLKDIQSLVQQLQQTLQNGASPAAGANPLLPLSAPQTDAPSVGTALPAVTQTQGSPQAIMDLLQQDLTALSQFVSQQKTGDNSSEAGATPLAKPSGLPPVSVGENAPSVPAAAITPEGSASSLIKSSIADVRNQLQKLKIENDAAFTQAKNSLPENLQAQFADGKQLLKDASPANASSDPAATPAYTASVISQALPVQVNALADAQNNNALPIALLQSQAGSDNSGDNNSGGNNQGQAAAQPVASFAPASLQANSGAGGVNFSRLLDQASSGSLLDQVTFQVKASLNDGSSKINIQLHPADLGKLDIRLSVDANGKTSVVITADNHNTLDLLQRDTQGLTRALTDAGLTTDSGSLSFNLSGGQQQSQGNSQGNAQPALSYQKMQPDEEQDVNLTTLTRSYVVNLAQGLDIKI